MGVCDLPRPSATDEPWLTEIDRERKPGGRWAQRWPGSPASADALEHLADLEKRGAKARGLPKGTR